MGRFSEITTFARFLGDVPAMLRKRMTAGEAHAIVQRRLRERERNLLGVLESSVFTNEKSPYRGLLRLARCEPGDVRRMLEKEGVDATLCALRAAGVYIAFEEYKGLRPIVRDGHVIETTETSFDNPLIRRFFRTSTGGTTGAARPILMDAAHLLSRVPMRIVAEEVYGTRDVPLAVWFEILPGNGASTILQGIVAGRPPERWFTPVLSGEGAPALRFRAATRAIVATARLARAPFPKPEHVPLDRADIIARWAAQRIRETGRVAISSHVSKALRICLAARDLGLDLNGLLLGGGGEPPTEAKIREMRRVGAEFRGGYYTMETGAIGLACPNATGPNDNHFFEDHLAVVQHARVLPGFDVSVQSFHFTTLLPTSPKLWINVELDDYGELETRRCGCGFEALGFTRHISDIRSFRKLSGEGMTLIGNEIERVLEEELPARCGGTSQDYQLVEEEDENGLTRLSLLVSPKVDVDEARALEVLNEALSRGSAAAALSRTIWKQGGNLRVLREEPRWTRAGKLIPFRWLQRDGTAASAPAEER